MQHYTVEAIDEIIEKVRALPAKDAKARKLDKRVSVKRMAEELSALQERGYTLEEIADSVRGFGFDITTPTLKSYLQRAKNGDEKRPKAKRAASRRPTKTDAPKVEAPPALTATDAPAEPAGKRAANDRAVGKPTGPTPGAGVGGPAEGTANNPEKETFRSGKSAFLLKDKDSY
jgi:hypothetical protein